MSASYLSVDEVSAMLRCDRKTIYREIEQGRLPALRVGRVLRVSVGDLQCLEVAPPGDPATPRRRARPREAVGEFTQRARAGYPPAPKERGGP